MSETPQNTYPSYSVQDQEDGTKTGIINSLNDDKISVTELLDLNLAMVREGISKLKIGNIVLFVTKIKNPGGGDFFTLTVLTEGIETKLDFDIYPEKAGDINLLFQDEEIYKEEKGEKILLYPRMDQRVVMKPYRG